MTPIVGLLLGTAQAGGVGAAIQLGTSRFAGSGELVGFLDPGVSTELALTLPVGGVEVGVNGALAHHNGCYYELQADGECPNAPGQPGPLIQGDVRLWSVGPTVVAPEVARIGPAVLSTSGTVQVVSMPLLMDEDYYGQEVVEESWGGQDPGWHDGLYYGAKAQVDIGLPVALESTAPIVFLGTSVAWTTRLGLSYAPVLGIRQPIR